MCGKSVFSSLETARDKLGIQKVKYQLLENDISGMKTPFNKVPIVAHRGLGETWLWDLWWGFFDDGGYNARVETVAEKPTWRTAWNAGRRAIFPLTSFYEGMGHFTTQSGFMAVAGLYDLSGLRVTMLTKPATGAVAKYNHRMPVILPIHEAKNWVAGPCRAAYLKRILDYQPALKELAYG